ncbi:MAG: hypothetical protein ACP5E9_06765 [Candidatus Methanospirareceae archaeon]
MAKKNDDAREEEIIELLRVKLNLSSDADVISEERQLLDAYHLPFMTDLLIEDRDKIYLVEICARATRDTIARLNLLRDILNTQTGKKYCPVIASKVLTSREEKLAQEVNIMLIQIPRTITVPEHAATLKKIKITSEKSWRVISRLLKEKATSIRQLALKENVSYGWAHETIQSLIRQGIVTKKDNYVRISDVNKLLNGVAWERPFENLRIAEVTIEYDNAFPAAQDISYSLRNQNIKVAFTSYTAGGLYTGYAVRHDTIYCYLEKNDSSLFKELFSSEKTGIKVLLYEPDRDVFSTVREVESVVVTSPAQTLLDLAGLGYSGMDIAKVMVDNYARI